MAKKESAAKPVLEKKEPYKVTTTPVVMEVISEPFVVHTYRGYAPVVNVRIEKDERTLYISSKSLAAGLELLRQRNGEVFTGIRMKVAKESEDKFAKYIVDPA